MKAVKAPKTITIKIDMKNDAFYQTQGEEVARILRELAEVIGEYGVMNARNENGLRDINGNPCGSVKVV